MMSRYFDSLGRKAHENLDGTLESDQFLPDFKVPKCYEIPKVRESILGASRKQTAQLQKDRFKQFPDSVLFYIFYS